MTTEDTNADWERTWNARSRALSRHFGKTADTVYHALVPFELGGQADVISFLGYRGGVAYVTSELTGEDVGQIPGPCGAYELMICTRSENPKAPELIARLARSSAPSRCPTNRVGGFRRMGGASHPQTRPLNRKRTSGSCRSLSLDLRDPPPPTHGPRPQLTTGQVRAPKAEARTNN